MGGQAEAEYGDGEEEEEEDSDDQGAYVSGVMEASSGPEFFQHFGWTTSGGGGSLVMVVVVVVLNVKERENEYSG